MSAAGGYPQEAYGRGGSATFAGSELAHTTQFQCLLKRFLKRSPIILLAHDPLGSIDLKSQHNSLRSISHPPTAGM
jgi:hypothetical protein